MQSVIEDIEPRNDSSPPLNIQRLPNYDKPPFVQIEHFPDIDLLTHDFGELNMTRPPFEFRDQEEIPVSPLRSRYTSAPHLPGRQRIPDDEGNQVSSRVISEQSRFEWTEEISRELRRILGSSGYSRHELNHSVSVTTPRDRQQESGNLELLNSGRRGMSLPFTPAPYRADIEEKKAEVQRVIAYYFRSAAVTPQNIHQVVSVITGSTDDYGALLSQLNILGPPTSFEAIGEVYNRLHFIVFGEERDVHPPHSLSYTPVSAPDTSRRFTLDNDPGSISAPNTPRGQLRNPTSTRQTPAIATPTPTTLYPSYPPTQSTPSSSIESRVEGVGLGSLPAQESSQSVQRSSTTSGSRTASIISPISRTKRSAPILNEPLSHTSSDQTLSQAPNTSLPRVSPVPVSLAAPSISKNTLHQPVALHAAPQNEVGALHSLATNSGLLRSSTTTSHSISTSTINDTSAYLTALSAKAFHTEIEGIDGSIDFTYTISCSTAPLDHPPIAALEEPPRSGDLLFNQFPNAAQSLRQAQVWMYVDGVSPNEQGVWVNISSNYGTFLGQPIPHPRVPSRCLSVYPGKEGRPRWIKEETWNSNQKKYLAEADKKKRIDVGRASLTPTPSASPSSAVRGSSV